MTQADDPRVESRAAHPTAEEAEAGSADPMAQAEAILEDSDVRSEDRNAAPGTVLERRSSEDTVEPVD